jgi:uncharacterized membrane protein YgdD (TMEM256/DUF423 family)
MGIPLLPAIAPDGGRVFVCGWVAKQRETVFLYERTVNQSFL